MPSHLELPRHLAASCWHFWTIAMETTGQAFSAGHSVTPRERSSHRPVFQCYGYLTVAPSPPPSSPCKTRFSGCAFLCGPAGLALRCLKYETFHARAQDTLGNGTVASGEGPEAVEWGWPEVPGKTTTDGGPRKCSPLAPNSGISLQGGLGGFSR